MATSLPEETSSLTQGSADRLRELAGLFEGFLNDRILEMIRERAVPQTAEPVIYSLTAGGKRIRPALCLLTAGIPPGVSHARGDASEGDSTAAYLERALFAGAALECIHTYSLIHDDLPPMDDDSLRRGRPSNHVQYSEWAAILAGDALNTLAFELAARTSPEGESPARLIEILAQGSGLGGMICGQALDLHAEKQGERPGDSASERALLEEIHRKKTGALLRASCEMGAVIAGAADTAPYAEYGAKLGLLFQISDDLLDETGDARALGKTAGKDRESGKLTYPYLYGLQESREKARALCEELIALADKLEPGPRAPGDNRRVLAGLPVLIRDRDR